MHECWQLNVSDWEVGIEFGGSDEHPLKALNPIFTDEGIDIFDKDVQRPKELIPIDVTDDGIVICVNDEHPEKALFPIDVTDDGIVICVNDEHS